MIFDLLSNHHHYPLGPAWHEAFAFLLNADRKMAVGNYPIRGEEMFAIVMDYRTQETASGELEAHRRYLDIQMLLLGREAVVCHFVPDLQILKPYDPAKDAALYRIPEGERSRIVLRPGSFLAFFPHDAHMPCLRLDHASGQVKKIVVKVAVDMLRRPA